MAGEDLQAHIAAALASGDTRSAAALAIRALGGEVLGYLQAVTRDDTLAAEAFSEFSEDVWRGIAGYRGDAPLRAWAYRVAWHAALRCLKAPERRRGRPLSTSEAENLAAEVRSTTALHLRDSSKDKLAALRASLSPEEQTLLVLRVDRALSWREIARVLEEQGVDTSEAALRKRFERLTEKLRAAAIAAGLLPRN
jgi:RNA polymerase sigma-70 factor (ECF subfamily)